MAMEFNEVAELNESVEKAILTLRAANAVLDEILATGRIYINDIPDDAA
jgi:hypothetical protein